MTNKTLLVAGMALTLALSLSACSLTGRNLNNAADTGRPEANVPAENGGAGGQENTVVFNIDAANFSFTPAEIRVSRGDRVRIVLTGGNGFHDWVIDEFSARTDRINAGEPATAEFTADKTGEFEFYCSVGNHRQMGMVGKLIVE